MGEFKGYEPDAILFLETLAGQRTDWFRAEKQNYQRLVVEPTKAFVNALGAELQSRISSGIVAEPRSNGSIAPIHHDLRFAPDKLPYKDHLLLKFWEGPDKQTAATLYVRIAPGGIGFATGANFADLARWRQQVASDAGADLSRDLQKVRKSTKGELVGEDLKRVPGPYPADHPRGDLLRHKRIQLRWEEPTPASLHRPAFVNWCAKRLERVSSIHRWLVTALG